MAAHGYKIAAVAGLMAVSLVTLPGRAQAAEEGEAAKEKDYSVLVETAPADLAQNGTGILTVTVKPKAPWALKVTTPFEANLTATAGVELGKPKLTSKDFVDPKATDKQVAAPFSVKAGGAQAIHTALNFFLCTEQVCQRYKEAIETKLQIAN